MFLKKVVAFWGKWNAEVDVFNCLVSNLASIQYHLYQILNIADIANHVIVG